MNLTTEQEQELAKKDWRVFTNNQVTQQAITEYLAEKGEGEASKTTINYDGQEKPVFIVSFEVVLFLAKNRHTVPYDFVAYHRPKSALVPWMIWREGKKSGGYIISRAFKKPISKILKKRKGRKPNSQPST